MLSIHKMKKKKRRIIFCLYVMWCGVAWLWRLYRTLLTTNFHEFFFCFQQMDKKSFQLNHVSFILVLITWMCIRKTKICLGFEMVFILFFFFLWTLMIINDQFHWKVQTKKNKIKSERDKKVHSAHGNIYAKIL